MRARGLPDTSNVRLALESSSTVMVPPVDVKGPSVPAGLGRSRVIPLAGTGLGMGTLKLMVPLVKVAGVAPDTSSWVVADPARAVLPSAAAAVANAAGMFAIVW